MSQDRIMVIKDCFFEGFMLGQDMKAIAANLHVNDGFTKEEIVEALKQLRAEAERG
jgi:hypothetical protein